MPSLSASYEITDKKAIEGPVTVFTSVPHDTCIRFMLVLPVVLIKPRFVCPVWLSKNSLASGVFCMIVIESTILFQILCISLLLPLYPSSTYEGILELRLKLKHAFYPIHIHKWTNHWELSSNISVPPARCTSQWQLSFIEFPSLKVMTASFSIIWSCYNLSKKYPLGCDLSTE